MPGFYADGEYDVAGFIVGLVARKQIVDGQRIRAGDQLVALPSSGLHTNGYSLARKIAFDHLKLRIDSRVPELGETVGAALLRTHRSYLNAVGPLLETGWIKGMAHITGGGIPDNLPRMLPEGRQYLLDRQSWNIPPLFVWLQAAGSVQETEMFRAFNMGVGLVLACDRDHTAALLDRLTSSHEPAWVIGEVT
jgi:phosphoribosylformylglycinamidine cyclo-ligase